MKNDEEWNLKRDMCRKFFSQLTPAELLALLADLKATLTYKIHLAKTMLHEKTASEFEKIVKENFKGEN